MKRTNGNVTLGFFGLGALFILAGAASRSAGWPAVWADFLLAIGTTVVGVASVAVLWRLVGGEPLERAVRGLETATKTLQVVEALGVVNLLAKRSDGADLRASDWVARLHAAREVDVVGLSLHRDWFDAPGVLEATAAALGRRGTRVRIASLCPANAVGHESCGALALRAAQEGEARVSLLQAYVQESANSMAALVAAHRQASGGGELELRTKCDGPVYAFIVRIDSYYFVSPYTAHARGRESIAFEVSGEESAWAQLYRSEIDSVLGSSDVSYPVAA